MPRAAQRGLLGLLFCVGYVQMAVAEPIVITSGFLAMDPQSGPIELRGTQGFSFKGAVGALGGVFDPLQQCEPSCQAGQSISLHAGWVGLDLPGTATLGGETFERVGGIDSSSSLRVSFDGFALLPARTADRATVAAPFTLSGWFFHDGLRESLTGSGTVSLQFRADRFDASGWRLDAARYDIAAPAPIPEPTTLSLLGLGLAALKARRLRQRKA